MFFTANQRRANTFSEKRNNSSKPEKVVDQPSPVREQPHSSEPKSSGLEDLARARNVYAFNRPWSASGRRSASAASNIGTSFHVVRSDGSDEALHEVSAALCGQESTLWKKPHRLGSKPILQLKASSLVLPSSRTAVVRLVQDHKRAQLRAGQGKISGDRPNSASGIREVIDLRKQSRMFNETLNSLQEVTASNDLRKGSAPLIDNPELQTFDTDGDVLAPMFRRRHASSAQTNTEAPTEASLREQINALEREQQKQRGMFTHWAQRASSRRGAESSLPQQDAFLPPHHDNGLFRYDSVWGETLLAELRFTTQHTENADGVVTGFGSLSSLFLLTKLISSLVASPSQLLLFELIAEVMQSLFGEANPSLTGVKVMEACHANTLHDLLSHPTLAFERLNHQMLQMQSLRLSNERQAFERERHFQAEVEATMYQRDLQHRNLLRLIMKAWNGFTRQARRKKRSAHGTINRLHTLADVARMRTVLLALRANAASSKEARVSHSLNESQGQRQKREAQLLEEISRLKAKIVLDAQEHKRQLDEKDRLHEENVIEIHQSHVEADRRMEALEKEILAVRNENSKIRSENSRWALLCNKSLRELRGAVEKRCAVDRGHPEEELLFTTGTDGMKLQVSPYPSLPDVVSSSNAAERILLLFSNMSLRKMRPHHAAVENFGSDFVDGEALLSMLRILYPQLINDSHFDDAPTHTQRAEIICSALDRIGLDSYINSTDIVLGVALRIASIVTALFRLYCLSVRYGTTDDDIACLNERSGITALGSSIAARLAALPRKQVPSLKSSRKGGKGNRPDGSESGVSDGVVSSSGVNEREARLKALRYSDVDHIVWVEEERTDLRDNTPVLPHVTLRGKAKDDSVMMNQQLPPLPKEDNAWSDDESSIFLVPLKNPQTAEPPKSKKSKRPRKVLVSHALEEMEKAFAETLERNRAWLYLAELTQRQMLSKMQNARSHDSGELLDERSRRHMEWFVQIDEEKCSQQLVLMNPWNARNEIDRVAMVLSSQYTLLRSTYFAYAALDGGLRMSQQSFLQFLKDAQIVSSGQKPLTLPLPYLSKSAVDDAFRFAVRELDPAVGEMSQLPVTFVPLVGERARKNLTKEMIMYHLSPQVFIMALMHISHQRYRNCVDDPDAKIPSDPAVSEDQNTAEGDKQVMLPLHKCLRKLIADDVSGNVMVSHGDKLRVQGRHPFVQRVYKKYYRSLVKLYKTYATTLSAQGAADVSPSRSKKKEPSDERLQSIEALNKDFILALEDAVRLFKDTRVCDGKVVTIQDLTALVYTLSNDDARLFSAVEDAIATARNKAANGSANLNETDEVVATSSASAVTPQLPGDVVTGQDTSALDVGQPEDTRRNGLSYADFLDVLTAISVMRAPLPVSAVHVTVGLFFKEVFAGRMKELHLH